MARDDEDVEEMTRRMVKAAEGCERALNKIAKYLTSGEFASDLVAAADEEED